MDDVALSHEAFVYFLFNFSYIGLLVEVSTYDCQALGSMSCAKGESNFIGSVGILPVEILKCKYSLLVKFLEARERTNNSTVERR